MSPRPRFSFNFHAEGHAFSAVFRRPVLVPIEAQASTSLPTIGGHAQARVDNFHIPRLVTFKAGHTHVTGSQQDENTFTTQATTTIEGLRILDVLTADRIVARLTSEHKRDEAEGHILAIGSTFENLKIGGFDVKVVLRHDLLLNCKTHDDLAKQVASDGKNGKIAATKGGLTVCSLVDEIVTDFPGLTPKDKKKHILQIPHFGTLSFAEVLSEAGTKTLTMLRFDLGSPDDGSGTAAEARTNGQPLPPVGP